ncbi:MAG TPA: ASCH domain-containing protein [Candidatus Binatia bacterium]|nr:ASCH domain-containing protein [Candidatus Binatia bacterium]
MGIYNFQSRFVPFILAGHKRHTIREERVHPDKPGNVLHLYTGLRTKHARLICRVKCAAIEDIEIRASRRIYIQGSVLDRYEAEALARSDGFESFDDMMAFWNGRLPFKGQIIHWTNFRVSRNRG